MNIKIVVKDLFSTFAFFTYLFIISIVDSILDLNLKLGVFFIFALLSLFFFIRRIFIIFKPFNGQLPK